MIIRSGSASCLGVCCDFILKASFRLTVACMAPQVDKGSNSDSVLRSLNDAFAAYIASRDQPSEDTVPDISTLMPQLIDPECNPNDQISPVNVAARAICRPLLGDEQLSKSLPGPLLTVTFYIPRAPKPSFLRYYHLDELCISPSNALQISFNNLDQQTPAPEQLSAGSINSYVPNSRPWNDHDAWKLPYHINILTVRQHSKILVVAFEDDVNAARLLVPR